MIVSKPTLSVHRKETEAVVLFVEFLKKECVRFQAAEEIFCVVFSIETEIPSTPAPPSEQEWLGQAAGAGRRLLGRGCRSTEGNGRVDVGRGRDQRRSWSLA